LLWKWGVRTPVLKTKGLGLSGIRWQRIVISVGEIKMISPTGAVCFSVGVVLGVLATVLHRIDVLNALETRLALSSNVALNVTNHA